MFVPAQVLFLLRPIRLSSLLFGNDSTGIELDDAQVGDSYSDQALLHAIYEDGTSNYDDMSIRRIDESTTSCITIHFPVNGNSNSIVMLRTGQAYPPRHG